MEEKMIFTEEIFENICCHKTLYCFVNNECWGTPTNNIYMIVFM